ncbi:radical SAM domain-containing protein [Brasilonema sp. UFV-L1]|nr:radical SAM domain-containing protein [Brasilonema sp. UFV-L1]
MLNTNAKTDFPNLNNDSLTINNTGEVLVRSNLDSNLVRRGIVSNRYFNLIILPTENCNFRCTYCYEDFAVGRMKSETILGIKALLERRCADLSYLNIEWFGGEPLTAKDIVLEISKYASSLVYRYPQLRYLGSMTTNAYLLNYNTITSLANVGVRHYQISLDGPRDVHNKSRIRADGASTFDRIWANLLAIRDSSLSVSILLRIHFSVDTFELIDPLIEDIRREFLDDSRFSVVFRPIERFGSPKNASLKIFSETEKKEAVKSLQTKLFGENFASPQNLCEPDDYVCYASRPNSLVIRSNGDVGKCTVALYDERNKIASLQPDGTLKLIPGRLAPWLRGIETLDPETLGCPLVGLPSNNEVSSNS